MAATLTIPYNIPLPPSPPHRPSDPPMSREPLPPLSHELTPGSSDNDDEKSSPINDQRFETPTPPDSPRVKRKSVPKLEDFQLIHTLGKGCAGRVCTLHSYLPSPPSLCPVPLEKKGYVHIVSPGTPRETHKHQQSARHEGDLETIGFDSRRIDPHLIGNVNPQALRPCRARQSIRRKATLQLHGSRELLLGHGVLSRWRSGDSDGTLWDLGSSSY